MSYRRISLHAKTTAALLFAIFITGYEIPTFAQSGSMPPIPPSLGQQPSREEQKQQDVWERERRVEMTTKENQQRQQEIKKDTDQLLALATQLKQYVDKTNENTLSLDVIKKAEEIERLARTVKQKMKGPS